MSQSIRETQRAPRSCTECSRRKIKCSKTIPCQPCVKRGESTTCVREIVRVNGKFTVAIDVESPITDRDSNEQLLDENRVLQARIQHLEAILLQKENNEAEQLTSASTSSGQAEAFLPQDDIISTFQGLHISGPSGPPPQKSSIWIEPSKDQILSLLPIRESSEQIVRFSLASLGWIHCALNAPNFMIQHTEFWDALDPRNLDALDDHAWMALYMSVLTVGIYFMNQSEVSSIHFLHEGFSGRRGPAVPTGYGSSHDISRVWYEAVFQELNHADFLGKPTLHTVQTLTILSLVHRNFGESERDYILLGVSINIAKALHMDRLGREGASLFKLPPSSLWADRQIRELGRRLWWTLVICDWMIIPIRPCSISPGSFSSVLSIGYDTTHQDIILNPQPSPQIPSVSSLTPLSFHLAISKIASIFRSYRENSFKATLSRINQTLQELQFLIQKLPPHLSPHTQTIPVQQFDGLPWVPTQRALILMHIEISRLNLCLAALPEIIETGEDKYNLRECGRTAAINLIGLRKKDSSHIFSKLWGTRGCTLAAGIYLTLDLICFHSSKLAQETQEQFRKIEYALEVLESSNSGISDSSDTLKRLIQLYHEWMVDCVVNRQTLFSIMSFAANPPSESTKHNLEQFSTNTININHRIHQTAPPQAISEEPYDVQNRIFGSITTLETMDFEGMNFDIPDFVTSVETEWPANAFSAFLTGDQMF